MISFRRMVVGAAVVLACLAAPAAVHASGSVDITASAQSAPADGAVGQWSALGAGSSDTVNSLAVGGDGSLYAGSSVSSSISGVGRWDGSSWTSLGPLTGNYVAAVAEHNGTVYAGGFFSAIGGVTASNIAAYSSGSWTPLGPGANNVVRTILPTDTSVYAGGAFTQAGGISANYVASWSGSTWSPVGSGTDATVNSLASADGTVYAGGSFTNAGGSPAELIAGWSGSTWSDVGGGVGPSSRRIEELAASRLGLVAGGTFVTAGGPTAQYVAIWSGTSWRPMGTGLDDVAYAVAVDDTHGLVYVGGDFILAGGKPASRIAVWDDAISTWIPLRWSASGQGVAGGYLSAVSVPGGSGASVYVGGDFDNAGNVADADNVARWTWAEPSGTNAVTASPGDAVSLEGWAFIGVPSTGAVYFDGIPSPSYTRDDTTTLSNVVVPAGVSGTVSIEVDAVGGRASVGTLTVPPPPPIPAQPPRNASAGAGDRSATVSWSAPASSGSYPVTNYLVTSSPGAHTCLTPTLECTVSGLMNGTSYTFTVQALTGAGWSEPSSPSNPVTPSGVPEQSIVITGTRTQRLAAVSGTTTGFGMGAMLTPWIRLSPAGPFEQGKITVLVSMDGAFTWERRMRPGRPLAVYFTGGGARSNTLTLR